MRALFLFLFFPVSLFAQPWGPHPIIETIADLHTFVPLRIQPFVYVAGYREPGDGGEGMFMHNNALTVTTNTPGYGAVYIPAQTGGTWVRHFKGPVDPLWWGIQGDTNYPTVPAAELIQKAIDYAEAEAINDILFGNGVAEKYLIDKQIITKSTSLRANKLQRGVVFPYLGTNVIGPSYGVQLIVTTNFVEENPGVTEVIRIEDPATDIARGESGTVKIENLYLRGNKNHNQINPAIITQVTTNRYTFWVDPDDLPEDPNNTNTFPHYGHVFFYDDTPFYVGFGIVDGINRTTGEVHLKESFGSPYATHADSPYLKTNWTAVFSPRATEAARIAGTFDDVSGAYAGLAGIAYVGSNTNNLNRYMRIENNTIEGFHVGIRQGLVIFDEIEGNLIRGCSFASIASPFPFSSRDTFYGSRNYLSGFHTIDDFNSFIYSYQDFLYSRSAYGMYIAGAASFGPQLTADGPNIGFHFESPLNSTYGVIRVDQPIMHGIYLGGGAGTGLERSDLVIQNLSVLATSTANPVDTYRTPRSVIYSRPRSGTVNNVTIGIYNSVGGNDETKFSSEFDIQSGDTIEIGMIAGKNAATNNYAAGSARIRLGSAGSTRDRLGTHWYQPNADTLTLSMADQKAVEFYNATFGADFFIPIWQVGSDFGTAFTRSDAVNKIWWVQLAPYLTNGLSSLLFGGINFPSERHAYIGEIFGNTNIAGLDVITLSSTDRAFRIDNVGDSGSDTNNLGFYLRFGSPTNAYVGPIRLTRPTNSAPGVLYIGNSEPNFATGSSGESSTNTVTITNILREVGFTSFRADTDSVPANGDVTEVITNGVITDVQYVQGDSTSQPLVVSIELSPPLSSTNYIVIIRPEYDEQALSASIVLGTLAVDGFQIKINNADGVAPGSAYFKVSIIDTDDYTFDVISSGGGGGGSGITDGDKGDITVSSSGATWTIDSGVVTSNKIAAGSIHLDKIHNIGDTDVYLRGDGTWAEIPESAGGSITNFTVNGTNTISGIIDGPVISYIVTNDTAQPQLTIPTNYVALSKLENPTDSFRIVGVGEDSANGPWKQVQIAAGTDNEITPQWTGDVLSFDLSSNIPRLDADTNDFTGTINVNVLNVNSMNVDEMGIANMTVTTSFDGNELIDADDLAPTGISAGTYSNATVTVNTKGQVTGISEGTGGSGTTLTIWPGFNLTPASMQAPTNSNYLRIGRRGDGVQILKADDTSNPYGEWTGFVPPNMPSVSGVRFSLAVAATSANTGTNRWALSVGSLLNQDIDSSGSMFDTATNLAFVASSTVGTPTVNVITNTFIDSIQPGHYIRVRIQRLANSGTYTMSGDAEMVIGNISFIP